MSSSRSRRPKGSGTATWCEPPFRPCARRASRRTEEYCERIGSTGLYPYAQQDERCFEARQFPKSSGYPEDAATGIAAAALAFGLLKNGLVERNSKRITVLQGRAMGALSEIGVRLGFADGTPVGCLLGGSVKLVETHEP